jgi:hypothetical protein
MVEPRPDDPFIIIRKENIKKSKHQPMQTPKDSRPRTSRRTRTPSPKMERSMIKIR